MPTRLGARSGRRTEIGIAQLCRHVFVELPPGKDTVGRTSVVAGRETGADTVVVILRLSDSATDVRLGERWGGQSESQKNHKRNRLQQLHFNTSFSSAPQDPVRGFGISEPY